MNYSKILTTLLLLLLFNTQTVSAFVYCDDVINKLSKGNIQGAIALIKNRKVHRLCSFHVAWKLKDNPTQARPHMKKIQKILNPQEPFYYKALYLSLLLLDDLTLPEIQKNRSKLKNSEKQEKNGRTHNETL